MIFVFAIFLLCIKESFTELFTKSFMNLETQTVLTGSNVILNCEFEVTDDTYKIVKWKKIFPNDSFQYLDLEDPKMQLYLRYDLAFTKVLKRDEGEYTCKIREPKNKYEGTQEVQRHITYQLRIDGTSNDEAIRKISASDDFVIIEANLRDRVVLPCEGIGVDYEDLKWETDALKSEYFYSAISETNPRYSRIEIRRGYSLEIQNVQPEDAGIYSCYVANLNNREPIIFHANELIILDSSLVNEMDQCLKSNCSINSDCYFDDNQPKCSCRKQHIGKPNEYCNSTCKKGHYCPLIACTNPWCKAFCELSCASKDLCRIQNYKYTCLCNKGYTGTIYEKCPKNIGVEMIFEMSKASTVGLVLLIIGVTSQL